MGLCNAFPDLERAAELLVPIQGSPPDPRETTAGCRFAPRCPFVLDRCVQEAPGLRELTAGHRAACWRDTEAAALRERAAEAATWMR
jgi:peptide/nickel transport system ATP-binding protein